MAEYTTELRTIIARGEVLPLQNYPIFNEDYRPILNKKIQDYFFFREIGYPSVPKFFQRLETKMFIIMPYYNKKYELAEITPDFQNTSENTTEGNTGNTNRNLYLDTPANELDIDTENPTHLTSLTKVVDEGNNKTTTTSKTGNAITTIIYARDTLENIDKLILDELESLFMGIY